VIDGYLVVDAHLHPARLTSVRPAWLAWAAEFGQPGWRSAYDGDGVISPPAFGALLAAEGVDHAIVLCE
jgi:hypothetical protein